MWRTSFLFLSALLVTQSCGAVHAQTPLLSPLATIAGDAPGDQLGTSVLCCDMDGDRIPDYIVGARDADPGGITDAGSVYVFSGRNGRLLRRLDGTQPTGVFGFSLACADVNRDRRPDLVIGAPNENRVYVYSGRDWSLLLQLEGRPGSFQTGIAVALCDVDGDRFPDIVAGASNVGAGGEGHGSVFLFSGKDGSLLRRFDGESSGDLFGQSVACCDLDRDGRGEVIVGSPTAVPGGLRNAGSVFVYAGRDGRLLRRFDGPQSGVLLGVLVASCDLNRDRFPDILIAASLANPEGVQRAGSIFAYSGRDGSLIRQMNGLSADFALGTGLTCCDLNRDGFPEVIAGAARLVPEADVRRGALVVFSGRDGSLLQQIDGAAPGDRLGEAIACCVRGRRVTGILVGSPRADPEGREEAGTVTILGVRRRGRQ